MNDAMIPTVADDPETNSAERDRLEAVRRAAAECVAAEVGSFAWYSAYHELSHALDRLDLVRAGLERGREFAGVGPGAGG